MKEAPAGPSRGASSVQGLGAFLRERRDAMGVTLAEVEVATRIRQKYLAALEADEWHLLPGEVVGRGFLRNYADYLGLEPQEVMDRRRAITDPNLSVALATTSAGAPLPPERSVDYRPKEVELKDEGDGIQRGEIRLTPILAIVGVALVVALGWWSISTFSQPLGELLGGAQAPIAGLTDRATATPTATVGGVVNAENLTPGAGATPGGVVVLGSGGDLAPPQTDAQPTPTEAAPVVILPTATPQQVAAMPTPTPEPPTPEPPTATPEPPTPEPPTPVPPPPTPEPPTPEPPTPEPPTPAPPLVVAPSCADARAVLTSPGVGQVLAGVVGVSGSATHDAFQYYKLEYAPGANAGGGFVYFDGSNVSIAGGLLGNLDTRSLPNGDYTIRLTVVDQSGNFPPPCDVSVVINN